MIIFELVNTNLDVMTRVEANRDTGEVKVINKTDDANKQAFKGKEYVTMNDVDDFIRSRNPEMGSIEYFNIMNAYALSHWDPYLISKLTNGITGKDEYGIIWYKWEPFRDELPEFLESIGLKKSEDNNNFL